MRILKYIITLCLIVGFVAYVCMETLFPLLFPAKETEEEQAKKTVLNIGVPNNLTSLPIWVAEEDSIFDSLQVSITVKEYGSLLESDQDFMNDKLNLIITDPVRADWLQWQKKTELNTLDSRPLDYAIVASSKSRITSLAQLKGKMLAVARNSSYSETAGRALDSVKLKRDSVYVVQVNDPRIAFHMLHCNSLDATFLPEPYIATAKEKGHTVLLTKRADFKLLSKAAVGKEEDEKYKQELEKFNAAYQEALRQIEKNGVAHYKGLLSRKCSHSLTN